MALLTEEDYNDLNEDYFNDLADTLFNKCYLVANGSKWRLVEIEFYLNNENHADPYVHCDPDQLLSHTFYFHRFKNRTYKSGTFKGMDITLGTYPNDPKFKPKKTDAKTYFGILIRSIQRIKTGEIIEGPCNTVNKLLEQYEFTKIDELTGGESLDLFENDQNFYLKFTKSLKTEKIYSGPRIGLSDKFMEWRDLPYRYVIFKSSIKKRKTTLKELN